MNLDANLLEILSDQKVRQQLCAKLESKLQTGEKVPDAEIYDKHLDFMYRPWDLAKNVHLNTHRQPLNFSNRKYLTQIYQDFSKKIIIKKSVQCGISEMLIIRSFAYSEYGFYILYVLPKYDLRGRFVHNRVNPLFSQIPQYQQMLNDAVGDSESVILKHIGKGAVNFVGSNSESEFIEYPADTLIVDELDRCNQQNLTLANDRLDASTFKHRILVSTPTIQNFGIDKEYNESDQCEWKIKCSHCNTWQSLEWEANVVNQVGENQFELLDTKWKESDTRDIDLLCYKCKKPINRLETGKWIPTQKHNYRGYHLSQLFSANTFVHELWKTFQESLGNPYDLQIFYNSKLGVAYTAKGAKLSRLDLDNCRQEYLMQSEYPEYTSMGVDVGKLLHVRISSLTADGKRKAQYIGTVQEFSEIKDLIKGYRVRFCVVDADPETRAAREFQASQRQGCVWLNRFQYNIKEVRINENDGTMQVDRTQAFDHLVAEIRRQNLLLPKNAGLIPDYYEQVEAPVRLQDLVTGRNYWSEGTKSDHYFLAEVYDMLASQMLRENRLVFY
jgi:hypothetical protein